MAELTPMMKQYLEIKEQNPDCILFFRLGDFYEMFNEDAKLASKELDLTLTTRAGGTCILLRNRGSGRYEGTYQDRAAVPAAEDCAGAHHGRPSP